MVQIFKAYDCPIAADGAVTIMSLFDNLAHLTFIVLVRFVGKRRLYLFCISAVLVSSSVLSWYGFTYLPPGFSSFDQTNSSSVQQEQQQQFHSMHNKDLAFIPMISLMTWSYFSFCTISTMPWIFMSELFSFKWVNFYLSQIKRDFFFNKIIHIHLQESWYCKWNFCCSQLRVWFYQQGEITCMSNWINCSISGINELNFVQLHRKPTTIWRHTCRYQAFRCCTCLFVCSVLY